MRSITFETVLNDKKELVDVINSSDLTQDESDVIMGLFDNIVSTYEIALEQGPGQITLQIKKEMQEHINNFKIRR